MRQILSFISIFFLSITVAQAQNLNAFKRILIADNGRIKPLDSFSKTKLLEYSGRSKNHNQWLFETLFFPEKSNEKDIFLIENPDLRNALNLDENKKRFSFNELEKASRKLYKLSDQITQEKEEKDFSLLEKQIVNLKSNFNSYLNINNSFLFAIENPAFTLSARNAQKLNLKEKNSLYKVLEQAGLLSAAIEDLDIKKNDFQEAEAELMGLSLTLYKWIENFRIYDENFNTEAKFSIIPSKKTWLSTWETIYMPNNEEKAYLWHLNQIYENRDNNSFNEKIKTFNQKVLKQVNYKKIQIELEILYNQLNPFKLAVIFFFLALCLLLRSTQLSYILCLSAFVIEMAAIIARIIIMQRPPVSNLYETFIFIAAAVTLLGLMIYKIEKNKIGLFLAAFSGFVLTLISFKFASQGDSMQALIAVLNSNFWLSTHVICISLGYAGIFAAGVVAHVYIIQKLNTKKLGNLKSYILGLLGFGLILSFLGTLLGGIWADQSWGRFWGWDPKENGALLIVLWTALIFHAKISGQIKDNGLALLTVFGTVIVMLSWLGVNLLGVGLHSYGFTKELFLALLSFSVAEIVFIAYTAFKLRKIN